MPELPELLEVLQAPIHTTRLALKINRVIFFIGIKIKKSTVWLNPGRFYEFDSFRFQMAFASKSDYSAQNY